MKKGISKHFFSRYKFEKSEEYKKDIMAKARDNYPELRFFNFYAFPGFRFFIA